MTRSSTTWTMTRTSLLRTSKPYVLANFGAPRSDTRKHLTARTPCGLRVPRRSKPRSTTSTSIKEVTNSPSSSATPLKNMATSLGRSSAEQASLAMSGTSPLQSQPSSWPPRKPSPDRSPVTQTMTMTLTMTSPLPMNRMTELKYFWFLWEAYRVSVFFLFMFPPTSHVEGLSLTTSLRYQDSCLEIS